MEVVQALDFVNNAISQEVGEEGIITSDCSNIVDVGDNIENTRKTESVLRRLVNHITEVIIKDRIYTGTAPSVLKKDWEYGSIVEKIWGKMPKATVNEDWELRDGVSYDGQVYYAPQVSVKFWNSGAAYEFDRSVTEEVFKQSFSNGSQMSAFVSMLYNDAQKSITASTDDFVRATINNFMGHLLYKFAPDGDYTGKTSDQVRNLFYEYTLENPDTTLTAATCWRNADFQRFAAGEILINIQNMRSLSQVFNMGDEIDNFTPTDLLHVVMLGRFKKMAEMYLGSDTYHNELVSLPNSEEVAFWQGSGNAASSATGLSFNPTDISSIDVDIKLEDGTKQNVKGSGIVSFMFDHEALGIWQQKIKVDTEYVAKGGFTNYFYKLFLRCFNDFNENAVMFITA